MWARAPAHAESARDSGRAARGACRASSVNCWPSVGFDVGADEQPVFGAPAGRASITRLSSGRTGICSSPRSGAWPDWGARPKSPIRIVTRRSPPRPTYWWSAAARPAWPRLRPLPRRARARSSLTSGSKFGGALGWRGDAEVGRLLDAATAQGVRLLARTLAFGVYDHNLVCASESLGETIPAVPAAPRARGTCASGCGRFVRGTLSRRPARSSARWSFRTTIVPALCSRARPTNTRAPSASLAGGAW